MTSNDKITFLGTGTSQGIPVIGCKCSVCTSIDIKDKRTRTSALLQINGIDILIDIGPDFRQQMLSNNFDHVDVLLVTHEHNDHIVGLDDIRPINFKYKKNIPLYSLERVVNDIKQKFQYVFCNNPYPGSPKIICQLIKPYEILKIDSTTEILALPILHGTLDILGFRIKNIAYITDASYIEPKCIALLRNLDVLIINALQLNPHYSHYSLSESLDIIQELNPRKAYLTHLSHQLGTFEEVKKLLPDNVYPAFDGLCVKI